jgi:hypothetical protein
MGIDTRLDSKGTQACVDLTPANLNCFHYSEDRDFTTPNMPEP